MMAVAPADDDIVAVRAFSSPHPPSGGQVWDYLMTWSPHFMFDTLLVQVQFISNLVTKPTSGS